MYFKAVPNPAEGDPMTTIKKNCALVLMGFVVLLVSARSEALTAADQKRCASCNLMEGKCSATFSGTFIVTGGSAIRQRPVSFPDV